MRRPLATLVAAVATMALIAGCGGGAPARQSTSGELKGEITFWHSFTQGPRLETIQAAADGFMTEHPGVSIKIETFSWSDFYTKWTTGIASGNVPDLSTALPNHVAELLDAEAIVPMDDLIDQIGRDRFYEAPLKEVTERGKTYAVPLYSHAQVMWYRKDLLTKHNLQVPSTWDELRTAASTITKEEAGASYGISIPMGTNDMMATRWLNFYVRSAGKRLLNDDNKADLNSPVAIEGAKYWTDMYRTASPKDSVNFNVLDQATLFYQGKTAFDFNSGFQIGGVKQNRPDLLDQIAAAPMPTLRKDDPATGYETSNIPLVVWEKSKHPDISKAFIKYLYQPKHYVPFLLSVPVGMLPALKEIPQNPEFLADPTVKRFSNELKVISDAVGHGTAIGMENGPVPQAGLLASQRVIENEFQDIATKGTPVDQAAQTANEKLNKLLETIR